MAEIRSADDEDFARFYGGVQVTSDWVGKGLWKRRKLAAFGCLIDMGDGVWHGFLDLPVGVRRPSLYRHILGALSEAKSKGALTIKAACQTDIPRAKELMERLGFEPTDEEFQGMRVWVCRN
ncbi:hypothetical protein ACQKP1_15835 [Allorhizobium sp. NPDC080224]|uniref:hypothetical protein n=1 Tax=Allorhizobium sp. NPDC080224 TaxID=3390547 RepID=UPI003D077448